MSAWEGLVSEVISSVKPNTPDQDIPEDVFEKISLLCRKYKRAETLKSQPWYKRLEWFLMANTTNQELRGDDNLSSKLEQWKEGLKALRKYGVNLISSPNHKLYHRIKLSSPFFVYNIKNKCQGGEIILADMGYHKPPGANEFQYKNASVDVAVRTRAVGGLVTELAAVVAMLDDLLEISLTLKKEGHTYSLLAAFFETFEQPMLVVGKEPPSPEPARPTVLPALQQHSGPEGRGGGYHSALPGVQQPPQQMMVRGAGQQHKQQQQHHHQQQQQHQYGAGHSSQYRSPRSDIDLSMDSLLADLPRRYSSKPPIARDPTTTPATPSTTSSSSSGGGVRVSRTFGGVSSSQQGFPQGSSGIPGWRDSPRKGSCPTILDSERLPSGSGRSDAPHPRSYSYQLASGLPPSPLASYPDGYSTQQDTDSLNHTYWSIAPSPVDSVSRDMSGLSLDDSGSLPPPLARGSGEAAIVRMYDDADQRVLSPEVVESSGDSDYMNMGSLDMELPPHRLARRTAAHAEATGRDKPPVAAPRQRLPPPHHHQHHQHQQQQQYQFESDSHAHYEPLRYQDQTSSSTYTGLDVSAQDGRGGSGGPLSSSHYKNDLNRRPLGESHARPLHGGGGGGGRGSSTPGYRGTTGGGGGVVPMYGQCSAQPQPTIQHINYSSYSAVHREQCDSGTTSSSSSSQQPRKEYRRAESHDSPLSERRHGGEEGGWRDPGPNSCYSGYGGGLQSPQKSSLSGEDDSTGGSTEPFGSGDYSKNGPETDVFMTSV